MSKISILFSQNDLEFCLRLQDSLMDYGHEIILPGQLLQPGTNLLQELGQLLHSTDAVVILITKNSIKSKYFINEATIAHTTAAATEGKIIIPVVVGEIDLPNFLFNTKSIFISNLSNEYSQQISLEINQAIEHTKSIRRKKEESQKRHNEKVETSRIEFIREAEERLTEKEKSFQVSAKLWQRIGYITLLIGAIWAGASLFFTIQESNTKNLTLEEVIFFTIKNLVALGLLLALFKYAFSLGKSYMNESLKNSDRLHAISFGKFYLQAYGHIVQPEDIKDVFQHWNIDKNSSFNHLNIDNFDPSKFELLMEIIKAMTKNDKK